MDQKRANAKKIVGRIEKSAQWAKHVLNHDRTINGANLAIRELYTILRRCEDLREYLEE
jgi:hypothetical protein